MQGYIDYCSQLYFPTQSKDIENLENLLVIFKENSRGLTDGLLEPLETFENVLSAEKG